MRVHHTIPVSHAGTKDRDNAVALCETPGHLIVDQLALKHQISYDDIAMDVGVSYYSGLPLFNKSSVGGRSVSLQWQEVDQSVFETYPSSLKTREPDDLDAVLSAVESGRVVQITVADEGAIRGRRMALGRRAKHRGCPIEMRYQGTSIVVRKAAVEGGAQSVPDEGTVKTDEEVAQEVTRRSRRSKTTA